MLPQSGEASGNGISFIVLPLKDTVDLYLHHEWSNTTDDGEYIVNIVVKDIGVLAPPFKPFHKWYSEDLTMSAADGLRNARENIKSRLQWFGEEANLLYVLSSPLETTYLLTNLYEKLQRPKTTEHISPKIRDSILRNEWEARDQ